MLYLGRLDNLTEEKRRRIEAAVKGIPLEKRPDIEECIDSLAVYNVKNHAEVALLYRIVEKLDLRNIINRHVIKSGSVDVGTPMIILAINRCLDAVALQVVGLVVTKEHCFPVFYNVFECSKGDMKTVSDTLKVLQEEFKVGRILLVRDREGEDREIKRAKALKELEAYAAKVNAGNYRMVSRVANKVKELSKSVSKYIKPEITVEKGESEAWNKKRSEA